MSNPETKNIQTADKIKEGLYGTDIVDDQAVAELNKFVLEEKDGDKAITKKMLKENFFKYEPKINEILNGKNQVSLIKKAFESAKTQDEKSELAVIFQQKHLSAKYDVALMRLENLCLMCRRS